nr:hypothetical protein [Nostoc sp. ChiSLP03a]
MISHQPAFHKVEDFEEVLKGARKGQHSIRINDQYRICFIWTEVAIALKIKRYICIK